MMLRCIWWYTVKCGDPKSSNDFLVLADPSKHRTLTEYHFLNVVTTYGLIQPVGYCSNHVLPDIRFLNMDQIKWKCNGSSPVQTVCANSDDRVKFLLRFIRIKYNVGPKTILIWLPILPIVEMGHFCKSYQKYTTLLSSKNMVQIRFNYDGRVNQLWVWALSDNRIK